MFLPQNSTNGKNLGSRPAIVQPIFHQMKETLSYVYGTFGDTLRSIQWIELNELNELNEPNRCRPLSHLLLTKRSPSWANSFFSIFSENFKKQGKHIKNNRFDFFISFLLFFLAPAVNLTIFGAGLTILNMFQGCFDVKCLRRNTFFEKWPQNSTNERNLGSRAVSSIHSFNSKLK